MLETLINSFLLHSLINKPGQNQKQETSDRTGHHQIPAAKVLGASQRKVSSTDSAYDDRTGCPQ